MRLRNRLVLLMAPVALALAGCFQQAGTALQEPISTNQAVNVPATSIPLPTDVIPDNNGQLPSSDTATPVVNTVPDTSNPNTTNPPVALTIISPTRPLPETATPQSIVPTEAGGQVVDGQITPTEGQFITPSSPLGPITQVPVIDATTVGDATATPSGLVTPTAFSNVDTSGGCTHTVQSGDTLYRIAVKYDITVVQLREANPQVNGDIIQPGDELKIPGCKPTSGESSGSGAVQPTAETAVPATALPAGSQTYVVKRGDTLYTISLKFGVSMDAIQTANNLSNPNRINPGQELVIPGK